jgi:lipopolysaccharide biosynthesis regulator YciM
MWEALFLLLPVAAFSGWWLGRKSSPCSIINTQLDAATSGPEGVETALALGSLFRKRGEVDKAIYLHQKLVEKPNLTARQKFQYLYELAQDYMRAGVYDRAENLFLQLIKDRGKAPENSLVYLIEIYVREKDWTKAIRASQQLEKITHKSQGELIAHFYCELAEIANQKSQHTIAVIELKRALEANKDSVRAGLLLADSCIMLHQHFKALRYLKKIPIQDSGFITEAIPKIVFCFEKLGKNNGLLIYLYQLLKEYPSISVVLAIADQIKKRDNELVAANYLADFMRRQPSLRGLTYLVDFHLSRTAGMVREDLLMLKQLMGNLLISKPTYQCVQCGFGCKHLLWQCPSCRTWGQIKPNQI